MAVTCRQSNLPFCFQTPVVLVLTNASSLPVQCRPHPNICIPPHQGRATYSDKLFKFRNGRFEDLLSDDINEHRDVANRMAGRSVACVDRKVIHTEIIVYGDPCHTHRLPRVSSAHMHGRFCLFTSDNSCPAYAALPSVCYDSSFGGMVCHFLASVHRTIVITGARARLFYRTLYEGRSDDCTMLLSVCKILPLSLSYFAFSPSFFSVTDTRVASYLPHSHAVLTSNQGTEGEGNSEEEHSRDCNGFFLFFHSLISPSAGCPAAKQIGKISAFNGIMLFK